MNLRDLSIVLMHCKFFIAEKLTLNCFKIEFYSILCLPLPQAPSSQSIACVLF